MNTNPEELKDTAEDIVLNCPNCRYAVIRGTKQIFFSFLSTGGPKHVAESPPVYMCHACGILFVPEQIKSVLVGNVENGGSRIHVANPISLN